MSRALLVLNSNRDREKAISWIKDAPGGTRVEFKHSKRSLDQNAKLWALLTEVSQQLKWHGQKLRPDDWKILFMDALNSELRAVPNMNGTGFVNLGTSSSDLSKYEMSNLIELILCFGAEHGVKFYNDEETA